ncbi:MAG: ABC transporter permease [Oligoflexia bacterium]|nr:ABC transporter permease [Oligoflexia bacterium]
MGNNRVSPVRLLASRFLLSKSSDGFLSLISWVSIVGVTLGVLALVVVTSVINGFEGELSRVITGMNGDVILYTRAEPVRDPDAIVNKIRETAPETQAVTTSLVVELMASGPLGVAGTLLEGYEPSTVEYVTQLPHRVIQGRLPAASGEVAVGSALADRLGVSPGSTFRLIIPGVDDTESDGAALPRSQDVKVSGIVKMGMYEYDSKFIWGDLSFVQALVHAPGTATAFKIRLKPGADGRQVAARLGDHFGYPFRAKDSIMLNKNLFYAIQLEKSVIAIILTVIVIVAAFNVVSTLMMMIHDKTKEIAILKVMGLRPMQGFGLFCLIGVGMGVVGTVLGVFSGLGVNLILKHTHIVDLPADIYYINFLPVVERWLEIGAIALVAVLISFLSTLYPGWKVAKRSPLDGIRYE